MPNLSSEKDGSEDPVDPRPFTASWVVLPLGTYLSSIMFLFMAWVNTAPEGQDFWSKTQDQLPGILKLRWKKLIGTPNWVIYHIRHLARKMVTSKQTTRPGRDDMELGNGEIGGHAASVQEIPIEVEDFSFHGPLGSLARDEQMKWLNGSDSEQIDGKMSGRLITTEARIRLQNSASAQIRTNRIRRKVWQAWIGGW